MRFEKSKPGVIQFTLDISEVPMNSALKERSENNSFVGEDKRGKRTPSNKTPEEDLHHVRRHIESFPITESHYTRKDTKRKYLDQKLSIAKMYALYLDHSKNQDPPLKPVGEMTYRRIFCKEYNLSFYHTKKDQCSKCAHYANLNTAEKEN